MSNKISSIRCFMSDISKDVQTIAGSEQDKAFHPNCILSPKFKLPINAFDGFESFVERGKLLGLTLNFNSVEHEPKYPVECIAFFDQQKRVSYEVLNQKLSTLDVMQITKRQISEVYQSSIFLNAECGHVKVLNQLLISELQNDKSIYIFFRDGFIRACSEQEAKYFLKFHGEVQAYKEKAEEFALFKNKVQRAELKEKTNEQAQIIGNYLKVEWRGVFAIQYRLLHEKNPSGLQKKNTVSHIRVLDDYKNGRIQRAAGQSLCGAKSKFGFSDDMSDTSSYLITCPKCLKMVNLI